MFYFSVVAPNWLGKSLLENIMCIRFQLQMHVLTLNLQFAADNIYKFYDTFAT